MSRARSRGACLLVGVFLASLEYACGNGSSGAGAGTSSSAAAPSAPSTSHRAAPPHVVPAGKLAGAPFQPTVALMLRDSEGVQLGFYQLIKSRERWRCEEPLGDTLSKLEVRANADWVVGAPIEIPLSDWSIGDGSRSAREGTVVVTVTRRDPETFTLSGTLEVKSADGSSSLSGPFEGEYCPTKIVARDAPAPLLGAAWTDRAFSPGDLPTAPLTSIFGGVPSPIALATIRTVRGAAGEEEELVFYREPVPDPCMARESGGWLTSYAPTGAIASRIGAKVRKDYFVVTLGRAPSRGDSFVGFASSSGKDTSQIRSAGLHVFEPDGYRSSVYDQYFSAALAFDAADSTHASGRVYVALPDRGKSMLVGAFDARRCPAAAD